jgi:uncharacterized protein YcfJ
MNTTMRGMLGAAAIVAATQAAAQVTFFNDEHYRGRSFSADRPIESMEQYGFNDRAASAIVEGGTWQVCEHARYAGRCAVLQPGRYDTLSSMNLNFQISSVRPMERSAGYYDAPPRSVAPQGAVTQGYDYGRRGSDEFYTADVTSVRAVMGPPEQRCWMEREQVMTDSGRSGANVGGAIAGAVIGGVLGHQIGSGRGQDVATAAGAVGGAALGSNVGRDRAPVYTTQEIQRCENVSSSSRPEYWDVTYNFRGREYHAQLTSPPGPTIVVTRDGEPRP